MSVDPARLVLFAINSIWPLESLRAMALARRPRLTLDGFPLDPRGRVPFPFGAKVPRAGPFMSGVPRLGWILSYRGRTLMRFWYPERSCETDSAGRIADSHRRTVSSNPRQLVASRAVNHSPLLCFSPVCGGLTVVFENDEGTGAQPRGRSGDSRVDLVIDTTITENDKRCFGEQFTCYVAGDWTSERLTSLASDSAGTRQKCIRIAGARINGDGCSDYVEMCASCLCQCGSSTSAKSVAPTKDRRIVEFCILLSFQSSNS